MVGRRGRHGFTLVEVLVALTLLSTVLLGIAAGASWAALLLAQAERVDAGVMLAASVLDSLRQVAAPAAGDAELAGAHVEWDAEAAGGGLAHVRLRMQRGTSGPSLPEVHLLVGPAPRLLPPLVEE